MQTNDLITALNAIARHAEKCWTYPRTHAHRQLLANHLVLWRDLAADVDPDELRRLGDALEAGRLVEATIAAAVIAEPGTAPFDRDACEPAWDVFRRIMWDHRPAGGGGDADSPQRQRTPKRRRPDGPQRER